jgi:aldehyde:ferredoxin oxidoreductase
MSESTAFYGYHGKICEIDLTSGEVKVLPLSRSDVELYLGGRGLATRLFMDRVDPSCDPLGPDNILALATSPLIGSRAPTGCRGHMVFKSPLTGIIGSSNCGGTWAYHFKAAGCDALVIRGRSPEPVFIDITQDDISLKPADRLWGMDVPGTTDELLKDAPARSRVLCIGPAGENLVRLAAVMNDKNRAYGQSGPGAVFGSKNLKAVRVFGNLKIAVRDEAQYKAGLEQAMYLLKAVPATKRLLRELGTAGLVELINVIEMLPHKNFQDTLHLEDRVERVSGETLSRELLKKPGACWGCPIACQRHTRVGDKSGEGPEYESDVLMGPNCDIYDLEAITRANYLCNDLGIDTISFGGTVACAMELFEEGYLTTDQTCGLELNFGRADLLEDLVRKTALRQGVGNLLARGSFRLAGGLGQPQLSMTVKKLEIPAYDPRASYTQALGYMTSPTGACHLRGGYAVSLAFFGGNKEIPRFSLHQSPVAIRNMQNLGILQDSLGICRFTGFAFGSGPWARIASGITGMDFSTSRLEDIANRIASLERIFNLSAGLGRKDDRLPDRFSKESISVGGEPRVISDAAQEKMLSDYYTIRGWDEEGRPTEATRRSLGLHSGNHS